MRLASLFKLEIIEDEKDGFLFRTGDASALESALVNCLNATDRMQQLTGNARAKVETQFTLERYTATMEQIYEEVLSEGNR